MAVAVVVVVWTFRASREVFSEGQRVDALHILVLITDGESDDGNATWFEARRTRASGVYIIAVNKSISRRLVITSAEEDM